MKILALPLRSEDNPYVNLLNRGLAHRGHDVQRLTLKDALRGASICHVHWPDSTFSSGKLLTSVKRGVHLLVCVAVAKVAGARLVWTVHNLWPHERKLPLWWLKLFYVLWCALVDGYIFLGEASRVEFQKLRGPLKKSSAVVLHGHYCDVYKNVTPSSHLKQQLGIRDNHVVFGHYGQVRSYKNIPLLISEFKKISNENYRLIIAGKTRVGDEDLEREIGDLAASDPRILYIPSYIEDEQMLELYQHTNLAIFPYRDVLNSGSAILGLSLACPVLVPDKPSMRELRDQVGADYVFCSDCSDLSQDIVEYGRTLHNSGRAVPRSALCDLEWSAVCRMTEEFYQSIC